ncbi:MAG: low specificity L-threonine aldolase [Longicatena sp.]
MKYSFSNDYSEGAHPSIMSALQESNLIQSVGYGLDEYCEMAKKSIQKELECENCDIHFLVGGTQANTTIIASALRPFECVISADSGHINVHETGAIEATGHKVVIADSLHGKLTIEGIRKAICFHEDEHMVKPSMVYISNATEVGTIYTKEELKNIHEVCKELGLYVFMDGARLGVALCSEDNDVCMSDLCTYCDVFYIGGTKNGAMFGEAVVIVNDKLKENFRYMIKQHGGMLAKGRLLGIQFHALFQNNLYYDLAKHANEMAQQIKDTMKSCGIKFFMESTTNQLFPILPNTLIKALEKDYLFQNWCTIDDTSRAVRFVTSWATSKEAVDVFCEDFKKCICSEGV